MSSLKIIFYLLLLTCINNVLCSSEVESPKKYYYVFKKPFVLDVKLGKVAQALHYSGEVGVQLFKGYVAYSLTGDVASASAYTLFEVSKTPPIMIGQSLADLKVRYFLKKKKLLNEIASIPGITSIKSFTTSKIKYGYSLAQKQLSSGLIFIESLKPLDLSKIDGLSGKVKKLGKLVDISDISTTKIELSLEINGDSKGAKWNPSLEDIFSGKRFPSQVTKEWREILEGSIKEKRALNQLKLGKMKEILNNFSDSHNEIKIKASLIDAQGEVTKLGYITEGKSTINLVETGLIKKVKHFFTRKKIKSSVFPIESTKVSKVRDSNKNCIIRAINSFFLKNIYIH